MTQRRDFADIMAAAKAHYIQNWFDPERGGDPDATWDYAIAGGDSYRSGLAVEAAAYVAAKREGAGEDVDAAMAGAQRIMADIAEDLAAYRRQRAARKVVGWSKHSDGKIRYAE